MKVPATSTTMAHVITEVEAETITCILLRASILSLEEKLGSAERRLKAGRATAASEASRFRELAAQLAAKDEELKAKDEELKAKEKALMLQLSRADASVIFYRRQRNKVKGERDHAMEQLDDVTRMLHAQRIATYEALKSI